MFMYASRTSIHEHTSRNKHIKTYKSEQAHKNIQVGCQQDKQSNTKLAGKSGNTFGNNHKFGILI